MDRFSLIAMGIALTATLACSPENTVRPTTDLVTPDVFNASQINTNYEMTDLGLLGARWIGFGMIDDQGRVTAYGGGTIGFHIFRWEHGVATDLGAAPGGGSFAFSPRGLVAGTACSHDTDTCTFFLFDDGVVTPLELAGTAYENDTYARAVGDDGTVLGRVHYSDRTVMTLWQRGVRQELPALGERFPYTGPLDMNKRGQIVAQSIDATFSIARPYLWENGAARDLGGLYDQPCPNDPQMPCGSANISSINDHGDIVGYSWDSNGNNRAVIWRGGGAVADLGVFPGEFTMSQQINEKGDIYGFGGPDHWWVLSKGVLMGPGNPPGAFSHPSAMNNRGEVIGFIRGADGEGHAFVWREGQLTDLGGGAPGSRLSEAWDINDRGEILGAYYTQDFEQHVVVWRPVNGKAVASNP